MHLNARIIAVEDGRMVLSVAELPALDVQVSSYEEISGAVRRAAAGLTGQEPEDFTVDVEF
ncbi:hypothetical protein [Arthrobacter sp. Z4-13]